MIFETEQNLIDAKNMVEHRTIFQYLLEDTIQDVIEDLLTHFNEKNFFQTVEMKTNNLMQKKISACLYD